MKLLQVGDYAPKEEEDRVINSRLSSRRPSTSFMEPTSEIVAKSSLHNAIVEEEDVSVPASVEKEKQPQDSLTDEEEPSPEEHNGLDITVQRQDSQASSNPAADEAETRDRALSAPLSPVLQVTTRPVSMSLNSQNMKRVMFGSRGDADLLALKEGGRDSTGSASDFSSTPERHYFGQITKCIAGIEDIMDSSRQLEDRIREKQSPTVPWERSSFFKDLRRKACVRRTCELFDKTSTTERGFQYLSTRGLLFPSASASPSECCVIQRVMLQ
ncbi:hypothetical protein GQ600_18679 [Phytophthora cactorum]|nr:hypothetical protein GQ600_18679 [Phytophthora cactorum]